MFFFVARPTERHQIRRVVRSTLTHFQNVMTMELAKRHLPTAVPALALVARVDKPSQPLQGFSTQPTEPPEQRARKRRQLEMGCVIAHKTVPFLSNPLSSQPRIAYPFRVKSTPLPIL
jgi:hypothetical protein